jgi:hypothetical protein
MLSAVVCAMLCGARSYSAIVDWIHAQEREFQHALGFTRTPPKLGAFRDLLMKLPPEHLEEALRPWVDRLVAEQPLSEEELRPVAMDGKSLRGTFAEHGRAVHLLSLLDQRTGFTLRQLEVDVKTNEHKAALTLLKSLSLEGRVITGDAMFCQRDLCRQIVRDGGHYLFAVKDNQPELKEAVEAEFRSAFSPLRGEEASKPFIDGDDARQGTRPPRAAASDGLPALGRASRLAGSGPSLPHRTLAVRQGQGGA